MTEALPKIIDTVRIKMVRVPENVALIRRLHILFSAGPSIAKFVSGTGTWLKFLTSRQTRNPSAHAALFTKYGAILSGISAHSLGKFVQTKGAEGSSENVGTARAIVYTGHFIRAGFFFLVQVPILPVLGLPFQYGPSTGKSLVRHG